MDPTLGLPLKGGMLQTLPANPSIPELANALNQTINKLNTWNGVIVQNDTVEIEIGAALQNLTTVPHGLAFTPDIRAALNNVTLSLTGGSELSYPLPNFIQATITSTVNFTVWLFATADKTNLYFYSLNATGTDFGTWDVTYYLMRLEANQNQ